MSDQEENFEIQQSKKDNKTCAKVVFVLFSLMLLALIAFIIYIIEAVVQNQDQEQVIIMGELMIIMSTLMCLSFIFYIYQLRSFFITTQNQTKIQNQFNTKSKNFNRAFCIRQEQMKFLPIHYLFLNFATALCLLILKLMPTFKTFCRNPDQCDCQDGDEDSDDCYTEQIDPIYEGPLLSGLPHFSICIASLIYFMEAVMIIVYIVSINEEDYPISYKQQYIQKTKTQANLCLTIFLIYSILKISLYIIILEEYQNPSSVILIASNIYFHCIMILIIFRSYYLVRESKPGFYDNFYNFMTLIYEIIEEDKMNKFLNVLVFLSIPFTIVGAILFETQQNKEDIINIDYLLYFDCLGIQCFAVTILVSLFLILPYIKYLCSKAKQDKIKKPYVQVKKLKNQIPCVICLQIMEIKIDLVQMRCHDSHIFHHQCIDEWLNNQKTCPICNTPAQYC